MGFALEELRRGWRNALITGAATASFVPSTRGRENKRRQHRIPAGARSHDLSANIPRYALFKSDEGIVVESEG